MMETDNLLPINERQQSQSLHRRLPIGIMAAMWFLGAINWPMKATEEGVSESAFSAKRSRNGTSALIRRIASLTSTVFIVFLNTTSFFLVAIYLYCYFGKTDHYLRFVSFICYWPLVMSTQIVSLVACISLIQRTSVRDEQRSDIEWVDIFNEKSFRAKLSHFVLCKKIPLFKRSDFVFIYSFALFVCIIRVVFFLHTATKCPTWMEYLLVISNISGLIFYATFCYYLFLWRIILEENCKETAQVIKGHVGELDRCIEKVREFFRDYFQLRKLLLPWLSFIIFSSTFGITVFFTWNYDKHLLKPTNRTSEESFHVFGHRTYVQSVCSYECDTVEFLEKGNYFLLYNIFVLSRHIFTMMLPLVAIRKADIKYVWDRLRMKINYMFAKHDENFWISLIKFVDKLHPSSTADLILALVIPLMGFAYGFLGGREEDF